MENNIVKEFFGNAPKLLARLKEESEQYWINRGETSMLKLFHVMAERVPAYKDFLAKHKINPASIKTIEDFKNLPLTSKENYLLAYPLKDLCWDGKFAEGKWIIASTSGSTGEPFYFPRTHLQDQQFALTAELTLREYFEIHKKSTLFIDCFALGVWIGGMFMYQAIKNISEQRNYQLSIITPGADKTETIKAVKGLAPQFDQVILGGYGPLVKDLIDDGIRQGIDWNQYDMKYFFAAEGFTEGFRDFLKEKGGVKNIYTGTINHYGTADLGTMAHETPLSILIRRLTEKNKALYNLVFSQGNKLPTLTQFIPELFFFQEVNRKLVCSGPAGLPLIRYDLKDIGEVCTFDVMKEKFAKYNIDLLEEAKKLNLQNTIWQLPFVYVAERGDFTVSIYSVNIYPESIRKALEVKELQEAITGKFTMIVDFDKSENQFLEINIELKPEQTETEIIKQKVLNSIISWLNKENSEWRDFYADEGIRHKVTPILTFWPYQHETHFRAGRKQKWVKSKSK